MSKRIEPQMSVDDMIGLIHQYNQQSYYNLLLMDAKDKIQSLEDIPAFLDYLFDNYEVNKK